MTDFPSYIFANIQPHLKNPTGFLKRFFYFWLKKLMLFLFLAGFFKPFSVHGKTTSCLLQTFKLAFWNVFFIPSLKFISVSCLSTGFSSYFHTGYLPVPGYTHWFFQWPVLFLAGFLAGFAASHWIIRLETGWHFFTDTSHSL